jgi:hopanoid C-2 methylase
LTQYSSASKRRNWELSKPFRSSTTRRCRCSTPSRLSIVTAGKSPPKARLTRANLKRQLTLFSNLLVRVGILADYRRPFWKMALRAIKRGQIDALFRVGFISYHLIEFSREALRGKQNASFYSARARETIEMPVPKTAAR